MRKIIHLVSGSTLSFSYQISHRTNCIVYAQMPEYSMTHFQSLLSLWMDYLLRHEDEILQSYLLSKIRVEMKIASHATSKEIVNSIIVAEWNTKLFENQLRRTVLPDAIAMIAPSYPCRFRKSSPSCLKLTRTISKVRNTRKMELVALWCLLFGIPSSTSSSIA